MAFASMKTWLTKEDYEILIGDEKYHDNTSKYAEEIMVSTAIMKSSKLFIFTASNSAAQQHLKDTIDNSVSTDILQQHLSPEEFAELTVLSKGQYYCWGATPGDRNVPTWDSMDKGDDVLTYYKMAYHYHSRVLWKCRNKELAKILWGTLEDGSTWEYIYFLTKPRRIDPPISSKATAEHIQAQFQGFTKVSDAKTSALIQKFGSVEAFVEFMHEPTQGLAQGDVTKETHDPQTAMIFEDPYRAILNAIKTKPFILLAGISGTGKSRLVRTLAYQTCSVPELRGDRPGNYALIMVKPNWHDPTELVGYVSRIDGQPKYVVTEFLRFLVKAWHYPEVPFFLCLDEMNLAPVEQYFADYLSVVETRRVKDGRLITDALLCKEGMDDPTVFEAALAKLGLVGDSALKQQFMNDGITLPPNLVVMGTVNMDETTHSFSRKVLDRAMTFEMNEVKLRSGLAAEDEQWAYPDPCMAASLVLGQLTRGGAVPEGFAQREDVLVWLQKVNDILEGTPFKVAYRVRDEFLIYAYHNSQLANKPSDWLDRCLDELLVMKVLSRIEGDEGRVGDVIKQLKGLVTESWVHSTRKLEEMQRKLTYGYTSYWS